MPCLPISVPEQAERSVGSQSTFGEGVITSSLKSQAEAVTLELEGQVRCKQR